MASTPAVAESKRHICIIVRSPKKMSDHARCVAQRQYGGARGARNAAIIAILQGGRSRGGRSGQLVHQMSLITRDRSLLDCRDYGHIRGWRAELASGRVLGFPCQVASAGKKPGDRNVLVE